MFWAQSVCYYHVSPPDLSHSDDDGLLLRPEVTPVWGHSPPGTLGVTRHARLARLTSGVPTRVWKAKSGILGVKVTGWHPPSLSAPGLHLWHAPASLLLPGDWWHTCCLTQVTRDWTADRGVRGKQGAGHLIICFCFVSSEIFDRMSVTFWALVCKCIFSEFSSTQSEIVLKRSLKKNKK